MLASLECHSEYTTGITAKQKGCLTPQLQR